MSDNADVDAQPFADPAAVAQQFEPLLDELERKVSELREGSLDAAALEARLRELNELAARAAAAIESAAR